MQVGALCLQLLGVAIFKESNTFGQSLFTGILDVGQRK